MIAIVCDTPYQLISAILVADHVAKDEKIVFFINRYLYFKEQTFNYCTDHPRIDKILYYGRAHMSAGKLIAGLARPQAMLKHIDGFDKAMDFTAIIASRTTYMATYLYNEYNKRHPNLPLYLVEEGIGEYSGKIINTRFTKACAALRQKTHLDRITRAYFSAPALYPYNVAFPIEKVPTITEDARQIIESIFGKEKICDTAGVMERFPVIFLSDPISANMTGSTASEYEQKDNLLMDTVADTVGKENMLIKVHPIDPNFKKDGMETLYTKLPMEAILLAMNCSNKVFISSMSTAMLTPKLLYASEPFLVFTYKLLEKEMSFYLSDPAHRKRYFDFMEGVMALYRDQSRCAVPETLDELQAVLRDFTNRI